MNRIAAVVFVVFLALAIQRVWVDLQAPDDVGDGRASEIRAEEGSETDPSPVTGRRAPSAANPGSVSSAQTDDATEDSLPVATQTTRGARPTLPPQTSTPTTSTSSTSSTSSSVTTPTSKPTSTVTIPSTSTPSTTRPSTTEPDPTTSTTSTTSSTTEPDPTTSTTLDTDPTEPTVPDPADDAPPDLG